MMPLDEKTPSSMGSYDFNFKLMDLDEAGGFSIVSDQRLSQEAICTPSSVLPVSSPPILKSVNNWAHETFLENLEIDDIHHPKHTQRLWLKENDIPSLFAIQNCPLQTSVRVNRNATTGKMLDFFEENNKCGSILTVNNSCSLFRAPGSPADSIRGKTTNYPFWPGGMDEERVNQLLRANDQSFEFTSNQKNCPPGFDNGINFNKLKKPQMSGVLNMNDLLEENEFADIFKSTDDSELNNLKDVDQSKGEMPSNLNLEILLPQQKEQEVSNNQSCEIESFQTKRTVLDEVWAEKVDITNQIVDFHKKVPNMAREWPFELDTFQKQAVLQLENHQCVFVAAHTSAGKTVVAEYAIALSAKHVTRVIYTSPIKALSNQKFRDFKQTIGDVGLVTGDVQINPDAFCLIMTTEILRSMLYNGSDVIRDLEWVIFDEVHYINDAEFIVRNSSSKWTKTYLGHNKAKKHKQFDEHRFFIDQHSKNFEHKTFKRGVVWEEVLIMLPDHCNVILLSATVPNTMEFANWVGKIKRKKMHVISTLKRPVPLEHYLYTGNSTKTSDEIFLLVDHNRRFLTPGYNKAVAAKNERSTKHSKSFGAKKHRGGNMAADKNIWLSLINRLRKKDQLPVVAFTFSRRRCDENAARLESLDLTSTSEKSDIHVFFHKCAQRLKGTDRKLPQVLQMATLLERGVGVHHSGILPILKEVVEMLFAKGLVKLLFATETFAMGVNMPARTVVFDSIRKHDGTAMRNLLPGEYIQMAGRAGRRGLDSTGTVIVLCKGDVPEASELNHMMLGRPTKLESQFRLTYGMILNLLRVEQLRVEEVLKRSFSEFHARKDSKAQEERLKYLQTCISEQFEITELLTRTDYEQYLDSCHLLLDTRTRLQKATLLSNVGIRMMQTGRVVVLSGLQYNQHIAIVLKVNVSKAEKTFTVLVLTQEGAVETIHDDTTKWHPDVLLRKTLFRPENRACQVIIEAAAKDISYATTTILKIPADRIIADHSRRQIPRFSSDRPDESVLIATQELLRLVEANPEGLTPVDLLSDLGISQLELVEEVMRMRSIEDSIGSMYSCTSLPRFKSQVLEVESYLKIKRELNEIKFLLSEASLHLLPEYQQRVEVLKQLRYIDTGGAVQLKGRVACEISSHEIVLTELVFENVFSSLEPAEIVALLSCAVFQQRIDMEEVTLTTRLKEAIQRITEVATSVGQTQYEQGIRQPVDDFVTQLKFGLVEVVYEWANGTSFKDITNLTDVQEGVIVRTIQRLNETCRDVRNAARVIGDPNLYAKMEKCSELIKRDIVFAASLYTH